MTSRVLAIMLATVGVAPLGAQAPPLTDTLPSHYSLLFEHGPIRVLKFAAASGEKTAMHTHPPHFAYVIKGGLVRFTYPTGQALDVPLTTGQNLKIPRPLTHTVEVLGADSVSVLVVEYRLPGDGPNAQPPSRP